MDYEENLDIEYKRYLGIILPYLDQLLDANIVETCKAWIDRLSNCKSDEKILRNKYIFAMCFQLTEGVLEDPFLEYPTQDELPPIKDEANSDESTESEYLIVNLDNTQTKVLYNNEQSQTTTHNLSSVSQFEVSTNKNQLRGEDNISINSTSYSVLNPVFKQNLICYNCSQKIELDDTKYCNVNYQERVKNIIIKLREIKDNNISLQEELSALKERSKQSYKINHTNENILKVDNATSVSLFSQDSTETLIYLKNNRQKDQETITALNNKIVEVQNDIHKVNMEKKQLEEKHKSEIIEFKASIREEITAYYENIISDFNKQYENSIKEIKNNNLMDQEYLKTNHEKNLSEKDNIIYCKDMEILNLKKLVEDLKTERNSKISNILNADKSSENIKQKTDDLEKRLHKLEKSKMKSCNAYLEKIANLQKEKHSLECSFHLQLIKQRAQVINELSDEHQTEMASALNKLEHKYKEIVANVQSVAIQRRIHDQMALESIIQAVCGARNEGMYTNSAEATCPSQLTNKATRNQTRYGRADCDLERPTVLPGDKVASVIVANKSFGDESVVNDYCLDNEKFTQLFEKMYIPQRDTGVDSSRK